MAKTSWLYSLIEYRTGRTGPSVVLGVALFLHDRIEVMLRDGARVPVADPVRVMMAARALVNRLHAAAPRDALAVRAFASKEANETRLSLPYLCELSLTDATPTVVLNRLYEQFVEPAEKTDVERASRPPVVERVSCRPSAAARQVATEPQPRAYTVPAAFIAMTHKNSRMANAPSGKPLPKVA